MLLETICRPPFQVLKMFALKEVYAPTLSQRKSPLGNTTQFLLRTEKTLEPFSNYKNASPRTVIRKKSTPPLFGSF